MAKKQYRSSSEQKKDELSTAIVSFEASQRGVDDYMKLFVTVWGVTRPGTGIIFSEIEEVLKETLDKKNIE